MNRKLKAMGLALFAAFALSAFGAQAASADLFTSNSTGGSTVLTSEEDTQIKFSYGGGTTVCEVAKFTGTQKGNEANSLTITPTFEECEFFGVTAEVRTNHCDLTFTTETSGEHAPVTVSCPEGEHIEVEIPAWGHCTLTIAPQTTGGGVTYTDSEGKVTIDMTATVSVTRDNPGSDFLCSLLPESGEMAITGSWWIVGYEDEGGPSTSFTTDETSTTEGDQGITHWSWEEGSQLTIGADTP